MERHALRVARYETVRRMYQEGTSKLKIAQELGMSRWLVRRFVEAEQFPERTPKVPHRTILTPFEAVLHARWQQGERTTSALFRILQAAGYAGSMYTVRHRASADAKSRRRTPSLPTERHIPSQHRRSARKRLRNDNCPRPAGWRGYC
jgi:transposase